MGLLVDITFIMTFIEHVLPHPKKKTALKTVRLSGPRAWHMRGHTQNNRERALLRRCPIGPLQNRV